MNTACLLSYHSKISILHKGKGNFGDDILKCFPKYILKKHAVKPTKVVAKESANWAYMHIVADADYN